MTDSDQRTGPVRQLRIGVDMISAGSGFKPGAGGMISYYDGLLSALCERDDVAAVVPFVSPENGALAVPDHPRIEMTVCRGLPSSRAGRVAYEQLALPWLARSRNIDVLLCTVNIMPLLRRAPTVVVLQSIQYFMWPAQVGRFRRAYLRFFTPRSLARADMIIAVTESARRDAIRLFDLDPASIVAVHHGVSNWTRTALADGKNARPRRLPDGIPYVLAVSRLYDFKNHRRLIEAFARLAEEGDISHHLLIAGGDADVTRSQLDAHAAACGVGDRVHCLGVVPQPEIPGLFAGADAVAYVSLYETFGHPVLEAFAFGVPLVTASAGATAEVAGDAARLVDPESVPDIVEGLRDVLTDDALRAQLSAAGPRRVAEFSWRRCGDATMAIIKSALSDVAR